MPFKPHYRISAIGRLGSASGEGFTYSLNMDNGNADSIPLLSANADVWDDIAQDIRAFHARADTAINPVAVLELVKVAYIGADGKYTQDPYIANVVDTPGGGNLSDFVAPQSALAISLASPRRGATGRGRFYIPMPVVALDPATMLLAGSVGNAIRGSAVTLLNDLNNQPGVDVLGLQVCVASSKGYNTTVTGVRVGRAVDTIRSRRTSLPESYGTIQELEPDS